MGFSKSPFCEDGEIGGIVRLLCDDGAHEEAITGQL